MSTLEEWDRLPSARRRMELGRADTQRAIIKLGRDAGLAWLEKQIESPITPEWGRILHDLNPSWHHLESWMGLSKAHCLAAVDALLKYCRESAMPEGGSAQSIHLALRTALAAHGNIRLQNAADEIRWKWPNGKRSRHPVNVPDSLNQAAAILFRGDGALLREWHESIADAKYPVEDVDEAWESLLQFGITAKLIAIVDWKVDGEELVASFRNLKHDQNMNLAWDQLKLPSHSLDAALNFIGMLSEGKGETLLLLDHGADDYPLAFLPSTEAVKFCQLVCSLADFNVHAFG